MLAVASDAERTAVTRLLVEFTCPRCEYRADAAFAADGAAVQPEAGDISLCLRCGAPLELGANMAPRWLTFEEVSRLDRKRRGELVSALVAIVTMRPSMVVARPVK